MSQPLRTTSARSAAALALAGLAALLGACSGEDGRGAGTTSTGLAPPRRIVLLSLDTVRADRVGGYGADTTPNLDRIASEGVLFERFYAASTYTIPSHMSVFTGLDPLEHSVHLAFARLADEVPTLAERLADAGYRTQGFHEGGYVAPRFGFGRGFESYVELPRLGLVGEDLPRVLDWIRAAGDAPYFLFLHTYAAHYPYGGLERYRREHPERGLPDDAEVAALPARARARGSLAVTPERMLELNVYNHFVDRREQRVPLADNRLPDAFPESEHFALDNAQMLASYDERIGDIDRALGRVEALLRELRQWDDTLLVVFSDHGEAFYEHGLQKHGYVPFDEVLKVPLVVSWPRVLKDGPVRRVDALTWHLDLMPTLLGLAAGVTPEGLHGFDLSSVLLGREELPPERALFPVVLEVAVHEQHPPHRIALQGPLEQFAANPLFGAADGYLFDLLADPGQARNLQAERADDARALALRAADYERGLQRRIPVHQRTGQPILDPDAHGAADLGLSEEELEALRALGYAE